MTNTTQQELTFARPTVAAPAQPPDDVVPLLIDVNQAARLLGCKRTFMYELIATHEIETVKLGRLRRVPRHELERFIERRLGRAG